MHLRCPHCQNPIELADLPSGGEITCAGCGSSFQLASALSTATWDKAVGRRLGKFELLGTLGQGAFGTVHKARDTELDRIVAIKIPRASNIGPDPQDLDRFLREARSVAQLRFPSIITIHEVGADNGMPYLVCDFVDGITLADHLTGRGFSFTESAKLLAEVADALQYAHSLGVVHRDVKPSNIMIRPGGSPCVMDFGLAKRDAGEITMTIDGQILGTPAYMSPEQARGEGHRVDGRSDVFSLGVILYQLLTGELPFRGNKAMLLHQVLHDEPLRPRTLNDKIPRDLETIALKAMAKEPGRRYASAKELADDLRRWLAGEPILARPVGKLEQTWRWCKRKPALATANAAVLVALATFVAAFFVVSASLEQEQIERGKAQQLAKQKGELADANKRLAIEADERREQAGILALRVQFEHYFSKAEDDPDLAVVGMASLLPKAARLKDPSSADQLRLQLAAWSPNLTRLRHVWQYDGVVSAVALSADGKTALIGDHGGRARVWDTATGKPIGPPLQHQRGVVGVALSANGKTALTASHGNSAQLWDTATGKLLGPPLEHERLVMAVALSADGKKALTGSEDNTAQLWDTATGKPLSTLSHRKSVDAVALSADGETALTGSRDGTAQAWKAAIGKPIGSPLRNSASVLFVALSADGLLALTAPGDGTLRLWHSATGEPIGIPFELLGSIVAMAMSADGGTALAAKHGRGMLLVSDMATGEPDARRVQNQHRVSALALSADGKTALTFSREGTARLWNLAVRAPMHQSLSANLSAVALSADGKTALTGSYAKTAQLWETTTHKPIGMPLMHQDVVKEVALSADAKTALTGSGHSGRLWETVTGKPIGLPLQHKDRVEAVALSADGKLALTGSRDGTARVWETAAGNPIGSPMQHKGTVTAVVLSADGRIALTGGTDGTARIWETATGKPIGLPLQHGDMVNCVALSADSKTALTGSEDQVCLWETATGKPVGPPRNYPGFVWRMALSADGKTALIGDAGRRVRVWDTATGKPVGPPLQHHGSHPEVALSADGKTALTGIGEARLWKVPQPIRGDPERIKLWPQVITGLEVDELTAVRVLDAATWQQRRQRLQELGGPPME